ncbi:MAG: hypothetical protein HN392_04610 [Anaerolineae bacterium]|nr:hypothetical protein [Anaerolineae bacterium]MBT7075711.1 hypothetical protein [Anaerolineae bacterium]MBT7781391.1 hypothetical protein [Anaerolineae bacterium]
MLERFLEKAPFSVTLLGILALILMLFNATRFGVALAKWQLILEYMPEPGPIYTAATGLLWAFCWLIVYLGIELAWRWSGVAFLLLSFLYASYYWLDRLFFQLFAERSNALFAFIATVLCLSGIIFLLALPQSRAYFAAKSEIKESEV